MLQLPLSYLLTLRVWRWRKVDNAELPRPMAGEKTRQKNINLFRRAYLGESRIISSHTAPQQIAKKISFQVTENDMMVAEPV